MNPKIVIRSETDADVTAISAVTAAAFKTLEISNHTEQFIIAALRNAKALTRRSNRCVSAPNQLLQQEAAAEMGAGTDSF